MNAEIDMSGVTLQTERLVLRPWRPDDLEDLYAYASVDGVGQMAGWPPHESIGTSRKVLQSFIEGKKTFALEYQGRVVGSLGIERYSEEQLPKLADLRCREIGYALAKDCWGRGLMPEAVREVLRWLFEDVRLDAVVCGHAPGNIQSARVQEKCGFRRYAAGTFRTRIGTERESVYNLLRRADWEAARHG